MFYEDGALHQRVLSIMVEDPNEDLRMGYLQLGHDDLCGLEVEELHCMSEVDMRETADWGRGELRNDCQGVGTI
jgi:hypothetical protein